jgi:acyl-coenzyme A thioesterase PaaI-like protein
MKNCHGGMLMAYADMALGHAITLDANRYWVTVRMVTDFVDSAAIGDWVEGTGRIAGCDDDIFTVTGRIWCAERTIMTATGIFKALGMRPPRRVS